MGVLSNAHFVVTAQDDLGGFDGGHNESCARALGEDFTLDIGQVLLMARLFDLPPREALIQVDEQIEDAGKPAQDDDDGPLIAHILNDFRLVAIWFARAIAQLHDFRLLAHQQNPASSANVTNATGIALNG